MRTILFCSLLATLALVEPGQCFQDKPAKTVEQIAEQAKPSVVVILSTARDGKRQGLGTGFVVGDGLIATNYHVIGEARPIQVQLADGSVHEVTSIHSSDRNLDLAVIRVAVKELKALPLSDTDDAKKLKPGQPIVVLGHPIKLQFSVVAGVLSGQREVEGLSMLQLAIPIEPGNSGGPVLDQGGKVLGIVTMKSLVTANLGFAVPITALKPLLEKPNPIPMERWLTIGQLDKNDWKTLYGGRWRQRAGRILVDGLGSGFGGRTLCVAKQPAGKLPQELAVTIKLDDEKGAAGLIFGGDGGDRHYGFYPTGGKLRLTHFQGPDVFGWKIIKDIATPHYRPGEWNTFKIRMEKDKFSCYCNDELIVELADPEYDGSIVGLASFRQTSAEFKRLQVAERVAAGKLADGALAKIKQSIAKLPLDRPIEDKQVDSLARTAPESMALLRDQARLLEKQAEQLRKLAHAVHQQRTLTELADTLKGQDKDVDLGRAALLIARLDNEDLEVDVYLKELDRVAREVAAGLPKDADEKARLGALTTFLFKERGFHGSRLEYYNRSNSYLNEVIDDREGLPITLSVLYMELARRLKVPVVGLGLPGHFTVRHEPAKGKSQVIDVFEGGKLLTDQEVEDRVRKNTGRPFDKKYLEASTKKAIVLRMLFNLLNVARQEEDRDGLLRYLDGILAIDPDAHENRWMRAVLRFQTGQRQGARADVEILLRADAPDVDMERVRELQKLLDN